MDPSIACALIAWCIIHFGALLAAWSTRAAAGSRWELPLQMTCFFAMAAVGTAAWICRHFELSLWIPSGVTLVAMVLTAVIDVRTSHDMSPVHSHTSR